MPLIHESMVGRDNIEGISGHMVKTARYSQHSLQDRKLALMGMFFINP